MNNFPSNKELLDKLLMMWGLNVMIGNEQKEVL